MSDTSSPEPGTPPASPPAGEATDDLSLSPEVSGGAPAPRRGLLEWLWGGEALRDAQDRVHLSDDLRERLRRARVSAELADRTLASIDPPRHGSTAPFALDLYRQAAYWSLLAQSDTVEASSLREAFERTDPALLLASTPSADALHHLRHRLIDGSFVTDATLPADQLQADAVAVKLFVRALLSVPDEPERRVVRLRLRRWLTVASLLPVLAVVIGVSVWGATRLRQKPNLAAGKPWHASSSAMTCHPEQHECGGSRTDIFFHTQEEESPWLEVDLQKTTAFSQVEIDNRTDYGPDRAVPLAVEVSNDHITWKEVARRTDTFTVWTARFAPQQARYVRMRALRRTLLHFEGVAVR